MQQQEVTEPTNCEGNVTSDDTTGQTRPVMCNPAHPSDGGTTHADRFA